MALFIIFNCAFLINCQNRENLSPEIISELLNSQPRKICGPKVTESMKLFCQPDVRDIIEGRKPKRSSESYQTFQYSVPYILLWNLIATANFDFDAKYNYNGIENYLDSYQDKSSNEFDVFSNDLLPYYEYRGVFKRHDYIPLTHACCRKACHLIEFVKYCPARKFMAT